MIFCGCKESNLCFPPSLTSGSCLVPHQGRRITCLPNFRASNHLTPNSRCWLAFETTFKQRIFRTTSQTCQEPWPWNCRSPKEMSKCRPNSLVTFSTNGSTLSVFWMVTGPQFRVWSGPYFFQTLDLLAQDWPLNLNLARLKWLVFLIRPLDLIGIWFGEDQRANIIKTHVYKRLDYVFKYQWLLYTQWWTWWSWPIYVSN